MGAKIPMRADDFVKERLPPVLLLSESLHRARRPSQDRGDRASTMLETGNDRAGIQTSISRRVTVDEVRASRACEGVSAASSETNAPAASA